MRIFHEVRDVPVNNVLLLDTREEAIAFPTGDIVLGFCDDCGFIGNTAFDASLLEYSDRYEETQGYSPTFQKFHRELAGRLIDQYGLRDKRLIEVGCGKGEFLTLLCEMGPNSGVGFDPVYLEERNTSPARDRMRFVKDNYSEKYADVIGDFLCCKMTLEHIAPVEEFVRMVRRTLAGQPDTVVYFQVPDVRRILDEVAFWDIFYEHCSYFGLGPFARLFRRSGFEVLDAQRIYDDQYLMIEARPGPGAAGEAGPGEPLPQEDDLGELREQVPRFAARIRERIAEWRERVDGYARDGRRAVIWGGGSKGVSFLTTLGVRDSIEYAVDINPHKHGCYMAGTGQEVVGPEFLKEYRPDVVIIMNPIYTGEITADLGRLGLRPEVLAL